MKRTHIYKIPEAEIQINPSLYRSYLKKYGQVHFEISESSYSSVKSSWNKIKVKLDAKSKITEKYMETILSENNLHNDSIAFSILCFLIAAPPYLKTLSAEHCDDGRVILIARSSFL